jgi:membrane protein YdbS with pleckstrin-like domain
MGIRVVPNETVPAAVYRVLLPHERQVITVRFHPAVLIRPVAEVLGGLALAGLLTTTIAHGNGIAMLVIWGLWLILVVRLVYKIYEWLDEYFVVTSQRLLLATGVVTKRVNMMPLTKVTDMRFERSPTGRLLGYGKFVVESAGQDQALQTVDHLPYPEQLYLEVCGLIFKDKGDSDDLPGDQDYPGGGQEQAGALYPAHPLAEHNPGQEHGNARVQRREHHGEAEQSGPGSEDVAHVR